MWYKHFVDIHQHTVKTLRTSGEKYKICDQLNSLWFSYCYWLDLKLWQNMLLHDTLDRF